MKIKPIAVQEKDELSNKIDIKSFNEVEKRYLKLIKKKKLHSLPLTLFEKQILE